MTDAQSIYVALAAVKAAVGAVGKERRNTAQNFSFRGVDDVVNAAAPALNKHGVIVLPEVLEHSYDTVEIGAKKTPMAHVILKVRYQFVGPDGSALWAAVVSESMDSGDKAMAKAMSVAYRIALLQVLNLPTDDRDPDEDVFERSGNTEHRTARPQAPKAQPNLTAQEYAVQAHSAKTTEQVRQIWKDAGGAGKLKESIAEPETAEVLILETYLQSRNDAITMPKSGSAGAKRAGGSGSK